MLLTIAIAKDILLCQYLYIYHCIYYCWTGLATVYLLLSITIRTWPDLCTTVYIVVCFCHCVFATIYQLLWISIENPDFIFSTKYYLLQFAYSGSAFTTLNTMSAANNWPLCIYHLISTTAYYLANMCYWITAAL
jgi:hypothetical protein